MARERNLLANRDVVLKVGATPVDVGQGLMPAAIDEQLRLLQVPLFTGQPGEFDQAELDLGMAADAFDSTGAEGLTHMVGGPLRDLDEQIAPPGPRPGHRRLEHVPVAVQLMAPLQVAIAIRLAGTPEHCVEVAVTLLGRGDDPGQRDETLLGVG